MATPDVDDNERTAATTSSKRSSSKTATGGGGGKNKTTTSIKETTNSAGGKGKRRTSNTDKNNNKNSSKINNKESSQSTQKGKDGGDGSKSNSHKNSKTRSSKSSSSSKNKSSSSKNRSSSSSNNNGKEMVDICTNVEENVSNDLSNDDICEEKNDKNKKNIKKCIINENKDVLVKKGEGSVGVDDGSDNDQEHISTYIENNIGINVNKKFDVDDQENNDIHGRDNNVVVDISISDGGDGRRDIRNYSANGVVSTEKDNSEDILHQKLGGGDDGGFGGDGGYGDGDGGYDGGYGGVDDGGYGGGDDEGYVGGDDEGYVGRDEGVCASDGVNDEVVDGADDFRGTCGSEEVKAVELYDPESIEIVANCENSGSGDMSASMNRCSNGGKGDGGGRGGGARGGDGVVMRSRGYGINDRIYRSLRGVSTVGACTGPQPGLSNGMGCGLVHDIIGWICCRPAGGPLPERWCEYSKYNQILNFPEIYRRCVELRGGGGVDGDDDVAEGICPSDRRTIGGVCGDDISNTDLTTCIYNCPNKTLVDSLIILPTKTPLAPAFTKDLGGQKGFRPNEITQRIKVFDDKTILSQKNMSTNGQSDNVIENKGKSETSDIVENKDVVEMDKSVVIEDKDVVDGGDQAVGKDKEIPANDSDGKNGGDGVGVNNGNNNRRVGVDSWDHTYQRMCSIINLCQTHRYYDKVWIRRHGIPVFAVEMEGGEAIPTENDLAIILNILSLINQEQKKKESSYKLGLCLKCNALLHNNTRTTEDGVANTLEDAVAEPNIESVSVAEQASNEKNSTLKDKKFTKCIKCGGCLRHIPIILHCTHGVNRTGYVACVLLMLLCGISGECALKLFQEARGHPVESEDVINKIKDLGDSVNDFIPYIQPPVLCNKFYKAMIAQGIKPIASSFEVLHEKDHNDGDGKEVNSFSVEMIETPTQFLVRLQKLREVAAQRMCPYRGKRALSTSDANRSNIRDKAQKIHDGKAVYKSDGSSTQPKSGDSTTETKGDGDAVDGGDGDAAGGLVAEGENDSVEKCDEGKNLVDAVLKPQEGAVDGDVGDKIEKNQKNEKNDKLGKIDLAAIEAQLTPEQILLLPPAPDQIKNDGIVLFGPLANSLISPEEVLVTLLRVNKNIKIADVRVLITPDFNGVVEYPQRLPARQSNGQRRTRVKGTLHSTLYTRQQYVSSLKAHFILYIQAADSTSFQNLLEFTPTYIRRQYVHPYPSISLNYIYRAGQERELNLLGSLANHQNRSNNYPGGVMYGSYDRSNMRFNNGMMCPPPPCYNNNNWGGKGGDFGRSRGYGGQFGMPPPPMQQNDKGRRGYFNGDGNINNRQRGGGDGGFDSGPRDGRYKQSGWGAGGGRGMQDFGSVPPPPPGGGGSHKGRDGGDMGNYRGRDRDDYRLGGDFNRHRSDDICQQGGGGGDWRGRNSDRYRDDGSRFSKRSREDSWGGNSSQEGRWSRDGKARYSSQYNNHRQNNNYGDGGGNGGDYPPRRREGGWDSTEGDGCFGGRFSRQAGGAPGGGAVLPRSNEYNNHTGDNLSYTGGYGDRSGSGRSNWDYTGPKVGPGSGDGGERARGSGDDRYDNRKNKDSRSPTRRADGGGMYNKNYIDDRECHPGVKNDYQNNNPTRGDIYKQYTRDDDQRHDRSRGGGIQQPVNRDKYNNRDRSRYPPGPPTNSISSPNRKTNWTDYPGHNEQYNHNQQQPPPQYQHGGYQPQQQYGSGGGGDRRFMQNYDQRGGTGQGVDGSSVPPPAPGMQEMFMQQFMQQQQMVGGAGYGAVNGGAGAKGADTLSVPANMVQMLSQFGCNQGSNINSHMLINLYNQYYQSFLQSMQNKNNSNTSQQQLTQMMQLMAQASQKK